MFFFNIFLTNCTIKKYYFLPTLFSNNLSLKSKNILIKKNNILLKKINKSVLSKLLHKSKSKSKSKNPLKLKYIYNIFIRAKKNLILGHINKAIRKFKLIYNFYPYTVYQQDIHISLIYAFYKIKNYSNAEILIYKFIKKYPYYLNMDYILYIEGLINISLIEYLKIKNKSINNKYFFYTSINYTKKSFYIFSKIFFLYKKSKYLKDSYYKLYYLKNLLAINDWKITYFYFQKKNYIAVINHVTSMLKKYKNTYASRMSLFFIEKAYRKICLIEEADKIIQITNLNNFIHKKINIYEEEEKL